MDIAWKWQLDLSAVHSAWCYSHAAESIKQPKAKLKEAAAELDHFAHALHVPNDRFWEVLATLTVDCQNNSDLAERTLSRLVAASPAMTSPLTAAIASNETAFRQSYPRFAEELPLRVEPLRQQWEAYGPGLLTLMAQHTDPDLLAGSSEIYLVQPEIGGAGFAHLSSNRIHVEAMLTNGMPELPEVLRLAWLLSQLDFERPVYSELISAFHLRRIAGLAMIPVTLLAGEELGICQYTSEMVGLALAYWRADGVGTDPAAHAEVLLSWWETYEASRPEWNIALTGLDRMLPGE